ncbi:MAG: MarR family transcriptional regulator [Microcoleus sp. T3-bin5]|nr:MarR family transcriptional regulator [Microcoleus sp. T3-bin5]
MKPQETVDYNIKACWHAIARMYNNEAARYDMTMAIGYVLLNIDAENGTPATKIAPLVGLETRSLTRMLKTLEEEGLISRVADEKDRRGVNIFLTEKGKQKREIARQTVRQFNFLIRENVPPEKLRIFFEVIDEINKLIEPKTRRQMMAALENSNE